MQCEERVLLANIAVVVGASGLVGSEVVQLLLKDDHYDRVVIFVRSKLAIQHQKLEQEIVDFDRLDQIAHDLTGADVFCTLGTTIKKAGSQPAFIKVDHEYPLRLAQLSKQQGAAAFLIVTALGANPKSSIFYSRVKGQLEDELKLLQLNRLHIFQPSMLLGDRTEKRPGEQMVSIIMPAITFLLIGSLRKYRAIHARTVAAAMIKVAKVADEERQGNYTYTSDRIAELAQKQ
jgi:uncharacterized protein YbjT (DUF2867 family)